MAKRFVEQRGVRDNGSRAKLDVRTARRSKRP